MEMYIVTLNSFFFFCISYSIIFMHYMFIYICTEEVVKNQQKQTQ